MQRIRRCFALLDERCSSRPCQVNGDSIIGGCLGGLACRIPDRGPRIMMICFLPGVDTARVCGASNNSRAKTDVNMGLIVQRYDSANQGARQVKAGRRTGRTTVISNCRQTVNTSVRFRHDSTTIFLECPWRSRLCPSQFSRWTGQRRRFDLAAGTACGRRLDGPDRS